MFASYFFIPLSLSGRKMLFRTVAHGRRLGSWNTYPIFLVLILTLPELSGISSPASILSTVVFPHPDGPIRLTLCPFSAFSVSRLRVLLFWNVLLVLLSLKISTFCFPCAMFFYFYLQNWFDARFG